MTHINTKIFLLLIIAIAGCKKTSSRLEESLRFAGDNRLELEKVLDYYKNDLTNGLKFKAACFLIENMPQYYSYTCKKYEKIKEEIYPLALAHNCTPSQAFQMLENKYGKLKDSDFEKIYDCHVIKADYLIDNIEQSFKSKFGESIFLLSGFVKKYCPTDWDMNHWKIGGKYTITRTNRYLP
jgi:hypothetical protein